MDMRDDDRGQAVQLGAVLLFGILIVGMAMYQVTVIPQQNEGVEYESYLDATTDMTRLRSDLLVSSTRGYQASTVVETGTTYPTRVLFVNPPPATGTLSTSANQSIRLSNAVALPMEADNTQLIWNGSTHDYPTKAAVFSPSYNRLHAQPVVVSGVAAYRTTDEGPIPLTGQTLIVGNRITIYTIAGDVSRTALRTTVTTEPVSVATTTVTIAGENTDGDTAREDFSLTFETITNATLWNRTSVAQNIRKNPNVNSVTPVDSDTVRITFDGSRVFQLRIARVELREEGDVETVPDPGPAYLIKSEGPGEPIKASQTVELTTEVRDEYNNPVAGEVVRYETTDGTFVLASDGTPSTRNVTTHARGHATVTFAPDRRSIPNDPVTVTAKIDTNNDDDYSDPGESTTWTIQVS